jgi:hypothetical protein
MPAGVMKDESMNFLILANLKAKLEGQHKANMRASM